MLNLKERKMLQRIYTALNAVPGAYIGGGTMSTTVTGVVNFGADMMEIRTHCSDALMAMFDGSYDSEQRDEEYNEAISKAEAFIAARKAVEWRAR